MKVKDFIQFFPLHLQYMKILWMYVIKNPFGIAAENSYCPKIKKIINNTVKIVLKI